jgi:hypothetical protein
MSETWETPVSFFNGKVIQKTRGCSMAKSNYCREHPVILMRNRIRARKQFDVWGTLGYHIFKPSHADLETISGVLALDLAGLEELNMEEMLGWGQLSMPKMTSNTR